MRLPLPAVASWHSAASALRGPTVRTRTALRRSEHENLYAIMAGGNANVTLNESKVLGGGASPISEESKFAVEGLSDLNASDQFGSFTITKSKISNNPPGANVEGSVHTNNPEKLKIFTDSSDT